VIDDLRANRECGFDVFAQVRGHLTERHIVELTVTIAACNCVSRFLEALRIDQE
jgi:alkylhydroperoxidase family enzyme